MADDVVRARFLNVLEVLYKNDAGKMSQELGMDRSTLTRYKNGSSTPSQKILVGLSYVKRIKLAWLTGELDGAEIQFDNAFEYSLPLLHAPIAGNCQIESMGSHQTIPYFCRPRCYYLDVRQEHPESWICKRDHCLIKQIDPRPAIKCDTSQMCVVQRAGVFEFGIVTAEDIKKGHSIHGILLRVERDLE